ncbi:MAG TPA: hypothetical protein VNH15_07705 [Elusimicrobiota bacterium]|nr:hypothetical protein [Elusimicrobiota bacterium]
MSFRPLALVLPVLGLFAGCASFPQGGAAPRSKMVEATGWAPTDAKDELGTRRRAVADAQARAIEKAVGVFLAARTQVDGAVATGEEITADARGYIRHYDILGEKTADGFCQVRIRALVELPGPGDEPEEDASWPVPPHSWVAVIISADASQDGFWARDAAADIEEKLSARGFEVVPDSAPTAASPIWTIRGRVTAYQLQDPNLGAFLSYRGRVSLEIEPPAGGAPIWRRSLEAPALGLDPGEVSSQAVRNAAILAGTAAAQALAARLAKTLLSSSSKSYNFAGQDVFQDSGH